MPSTILGELKAIEFVESREYALPTATPSLDRTISRETATVATQSPDNRVLRLRSLDVQGRFLTVIRFDEDP
jgi:hypothetical protein